MAAGCTHAIGKFHIMLTPAATRLPGQARRAVGRARTGE